MVFQDRRNSAFLIRPSGRLDVEHYDKIHLVPFGEYIPFKDSEWFGWLHKIFLAFNPYDYDYTLTTGGNVQNPAVFRLNINGNPTVRVITPICFEDIDPALCAALFRSPSGKRADLLVNLTNDGWFKANENAQHLQAAIFRSIENRVPTARSVNTGISAFIDSYGRISETVPVRTQGVAVQQVMLDSRYTLYTRIGDLFAWLCTLITLMFIGFAMADHRSGRHP
jgi:apolipoprotein N-acyltransferase